MPAAVWRSQRALLRPVVAVYPVEELISLSDPFGLWLSFYQTDMPGYLAIVESYFRDFQGDRAALHQAARLFSMARGSRRGRTAKQFYNAFSAQDFSRLTAD